MPFSLARAAIVSPTFFAAATLPVLSRPSATVFSTVDALTTVTDASGAIQETVSLPTDVAAGLGKWGLEGVTVTGSGAGETVYVALQRALTGETASRIGRYQPATGQWTWFGYPLETTTVAGDWVGLSEITTVRGVGYRWR